MTTVFIGGSRHISRLSADAKTRLQNIIENGFPVVLGDANGADKAIQKFMADAAYDKVTVFCSGEKPRNNLGHWKLHSVIPSKTVKGFQFYAAKDREMASTADFGLMIWDGKSPGTALNILRLVRAGKKAVLLNMSEKKATTFRTTTDWSDFVSRCDSEFVSDLRKRATPDEWPAQPQQAVFKDFVDAREEASAQAAPLGSDEDLTTDINNAFASGDMAAVVNLLGSFAKAHGMAAVAKKSGLSRESLYKSLSADGNPEFSTILKVIGSLGYRLSVNRAETSSAAPH